MVRNTSTQSLMGWGRTMGSNAVVREVGAVRMSDLMGLVTDRGAIVRGLGRAYGDAAQNGGGTVFRLPDEIDSVTVDSTSGTVRCSAGVSLDSLMKVLVPRGFFVPVTPGTRFVTVGGAIASDIHGKNHHVDGSFGSHVREISLLLADGSVVSTDPNNDPDLFWATIGGMGLTGAILEATFSLLPIETSVCTVDTCRFANIDELLGAMSDSDDDYRYSVAWTDLLATGKHLGRSILWRGDHARRDDVANAKSDPFVYHTKRLGSVPPFVPHAGIVNRWTSQMFNELWYRKAPFRRIAEIKSIPAFFHPLDAVGDWNRLYGSFGFLQYQFVVPFGAEDDLRSIIQEVAESKVATPLVVLKRFGPGNAGMLSFPTSGWTLTVDIPARVDGLPGLLRRLDEQVLAAGGRHYLAKDALVAPDAIVQGYPRLDEWRAVKARVDPQGLWTSDMARRLKLFETKGRQ